MNRRIKPIGLMLLIVLAGSFGPAHADDRRDSAEMLQLFRPLTAAVRDGTASVISGTKVVALATVVDADGYLVTKRSELSGDPIRVRLGDGRMYPARVAAVRRQNDLALLKIDADVELTPLQFDNYLPGMASFLISVGRTGRAIGIGVTGARERRIAPQGRLGVYLADDSTTGRALVSDVISGSGADDAGLVPGDVIVQIDGTDQLNSDRVRNTLQSMYPGEEVRLTVIRQTDPEGDERLSPERLEVAARIQDFGLLRESENDLLVNGPRNDRMSGFDRVIQHDTVLDVDECGGPVLDSAGRVVGLNIARAGRVVTYALPSSLVNSEVTQMLDEAKR